MQAQMQNPTQMQRYGRSQRRVEDEDEEEEIALNEDNEPDANGTGTVRDPTTLTGKKTYLTGLTIGPEEMCN
jgi:hypothetical protein